MGCWQALGAHAEAGMLAAVREIIRRRAPRVKNGKAKTPVAMYPGDLPAEWGIGIAHEAAAALGISWQAADAILNFAFELEARLPGVGQLLDDGVITPMKAKIVVQELSLLDDEKIAEAEKLLLEHDFRSATMTPGRSGCCASVLPTRSILRDRGSAENRLSGRMPGSGSSVPTVAQDPCSPPGCRPTRR